MPSQPSTPLPAPSLVPSADPGAGPAPGPVLRLRRGVPTFTRDDGLLVVGVDPRQQVVLPDTSVVSRVLVQLRHGMPAAPDEGADAAVLAALAGAGLLVDVAEQQLLTAARASTRVRVVVPPPWRRRAESCLEQVGLGVAGERGEADLTWVVSAGPVPWQVHDDLLAADTVTLFTTALPSRVVVGPFVVPGTTACLRCTGEGATGVRPPSGATLEELPDDLPPLLLGRALTLGADDLSAWAEGRQPVTWSATVALAEQLTASRHPWAQHPHCGCCWDRRSLTG